MENSNGPFAEPDPQHDSSPNPEGPGSRFRDEMMNLTRKTTGAIYAEATRIRRPSIDLEILERLSAVESRLTDIERRLNLPPAA